MNKTSQVFKWIAIAGAVMLTCGVLFVSFVFFVVVPAQKTIINVVSKPVDEAKEAVRMYYASHNRLPTNLVELADFAQDNSLSFDGASYKSMSFAMTNETVYVSCTGRFSQGWFNFPLEEPVNDFMGDHPEYEQFLEDPRDLTKVICAFYDERNALPEDLDDLKEFVSSSKLDVDLTPYQSVFVKKRLFGDVKVEYKTVPVDNNHRSGTFPIPKTYLKRIK
ncbi:MAG: hypothetical protein PF692_05145 [Kiritimatiellae bacterium]|jgi:hypothetical protein|nr:hypothetical protein [Kiritimatiellia bacterium]